MRRHQLTLRQWMIALAILGVLFALIGRSSDPVGSLVLVYLVAAFPSVMLLVFLRARSSPPLSLIGNVIVALVFLVLFSTLASYPEVPGAITGPWALCSLVAPPIYLLTKLSFRYRLPVEVAILIVLLFSSAWTRQHEIYSRHAARAARLAQLASTWAKETDSPNGRTLFDSEAAWFAHKALVYRSRALGYGLIRVVFPSFARPTGDDRELILDLGISEVIDWHESDIVREHARLYPLPETQGP